MRTVTLAVITTGTATPVMTNAEIVDEQTSIPMLTSALVIGDAMDYIYTITVQKPGHHEPLIYGAKTFAAGAALRDMFTERGWPFEITGSEPIFARLEM